MVTDVESPAPQTCFSKVDAAEAKICATGTAWGLLKDQSSGVLVAFWFVRHMLYFGIAVALVTQVPASVTAVVIFFVVIHSYKTGVFIARDGAETRRKEAANRATKEIEQEARLRQTPLSQ